MAKMTSAEAAKLLRSLNEKRQELLAKERQTSSFIAALEEDPETVRPEYDFAAVQDKLREIEEEIRRVKHAVNKFNLTTEIPGFGMTIDQMLVYIPQLSERKAKLQMMQRMLPKQREMNRMVRTNSIDYRYANFNVNAARAAFLEASDLLAKAQTALDAVNSGVEFEI